MAWGRSKSSGSEIAATSPAGSALEPPRGCGVGLRSQSGASHGCNETFAPKACLLRRQDGRKQRARAEEIAGDASAHARWLFALGRASPLVQDEGPPQSARAIQTGEHAPQKARQARGLIGIVSRSAGRRG